MGMKKLKIDQRNIFRVSKMSKLTHSTISLSLSTETIDLSLLWEFIIRYKDTWRYQLAVF